MTRRSDSAFQRPPTSQARTHSRCGPELAAGPAAAAACLRAAAQAGCVLDGAEWQGRPSWHDVHNGVRPAQCDLPAHGERCQGWQHHSSHACSTHFRETELLPTLPPSAQAMFCSQSGPHAAAWLSAIPSEAGSALPPDRMAAAAAATFACRSTQVWRTWARLWSRCRRLWRPPRNMPSNQTARPPNKARRACMGAHRA